MLHRATSIATVLLAGCASMIPMAQYTPRMTVTTEASEFESTVKFLGIEVPYGEGDPLNHHFLRSWLDKDTGAVTHQLYVINFYREDWRFWRSANNQQAAPLGFTAINQDVISCSTYSGCLHSESFGIDIPDDVLVANPDGYAIKVYARSGDTMVLTVTAAQIRGQLEAIRRYRGVSTTP